MVSWEWSKNKCMEGPLAWINGHPLCEQEQPHGKRDGKYEGL